MRHLIRRPAIVLGLLCLIADIEEFLILFSGQRFFQNLLYFFCPVFAQHILDKQFDGIRIDPIRILAGRLFAGNIGFFPHIRIDRIVRLSGKIDHRPVRRIRVVFFRRFKRPFHTVTQIDLIHAGIFFRLKTADDEFDALFQRIAE